MSKQTELQQMKSKAASVLANNTHEMTGQEIAYKAGLLAGPHFYACLSELINEGKATRHDRQGFTVYLPTPKPAKSGEEGLFLDSDDVAELSDLIDDSIIRLEELRTSPLLSDLLSDLSRYKRKFDASLDETRAPE